MLAGVASDRPWQHTQKHTRGFLVCKHAAQKATLFQTVKHICRDGGRSVSFRSSNTAVSQPTGGRRGQREPI